MFAENISSRLAAVAKLKMCVWTISGSHFFYLSWLVQMLTAWGVLLLTLDLKTGVGTAWRDVSPSILRGSSLTSTYFVRVTSAAGQSLRHQRFLLTRSPYSHYIKIHDRYQQQHTAPKSEINLASSNRHPEANIIILFGLLGQTYRVTVVFWLKLTAKIGWDAEREPSLQKA